MGPDYGYYPNATKTWLIVKDDYLEEAKDTFSDSGVSITVEGKRYLGAVIGSSKSVTDYVEQKVTEWINEVESLSSIATTQPHAAYATFTHGLKHKWTYLTRTIANIDHRLQPLEDVIRGTFIPSLTGQIAFNEETRDLMALPVRLGGLGIINPTRHNTLNHQSSLSTTTTPLISLILEQSHTYLQETKAEQLQAKKEVKKNCRQQYTATVAELEVKLSNNMKRALQVLTASGWLATLPIADHGFALHKRGNHLIYLHIVFVVTNLRWNTH